MKQLITSTLFLCITTFMFAQVIADFEDLIVEPESFLNDAGEENTFDSKGLILYNNYVPEWESWDGWAISNSTDSQTPGFANQYSSIVGSGAGTAESYAVSYVVGSSSIVVDNEQNIDNIDGIYVTNNTYAYYSMLEGDAFAKKFGGLTGDDPDFYKLTIYGYRDGTYLDSLDYYLADYRFEDNSQDYILSDWHYIKISELGEPDSLEFFLSSSDNGIFGMNTPAYFCMDDVEMSTITSTSDPNESISLVIYPNPTSERLTISAQQTINRITLVNATGQEVKVIEGDKSEYTLFINELETGIYTMFITSKGQQITQSVVKY